VSSLCARQTQASIVLIFFIKNSQQKKYSLAFQVEFITPDSLPMWEDIQGEKWSNI
jgi:hypothetical protein